jgi:uncharacterized membrane protein YhfC
MIILAYILNFGLMILLPIWLGIIVSRRRGAGWGLFGLGAFTFFLSQLFHIPFNWLVLQRFELLPTDFSDQGNLLLLALFLGLSAGLFEESARYLMLRYSATTARTWGRGIMFGAGHGGLEAILLGVLGLINANILYAMYNGQMLNLVTPEQMPLLQTQLDSMFSLPWYMVLLGAVERLFALCLHVAATLLVMQSLTRGGLKWLLAAIGLHTLLNAVAVYTAVTYNAVTAEGAIGLVALVALGIIFWLRQPEPVAPEPAPLPETLTAATLNLEITEDILENSRYS